MPYAIVTVPVAPMRASAAHRSEMVSQLLWGSCVEILSTTADGWAEIRNQYDNYTGWASLSHLETIDTALYEAPASHFTPSWANLVKMNGIPMHVPYGCPVKQYAGNTARWGDISVSFEEPLPGILSHQPVDATALKAAAFQFLNTAYLWGGASVFGVDCSGFTQHVFRLFGIPLLRDAYLQATQGQLVDFLQQARLGDLAFFDNEEGRITHVGILLSEQEIIHSAGKVRIDPIDNQGITNKDTGLRTHRLRIIKRFF
ncbi:cell wall-associated NlpC family hydrolase [Chitinophaga terrae (ex Kim and Jung 2007)]|uniref:C40 family peptidase n=1 Tax=Chitinophaga terrae (ex Kim and Jung 2007) TaxID=408074 RepID=UPI0027847711|nr:C40 family peptidase [Chitinophaga terrae (ex Kim and Jung 2007)]MDQ0107299.1 cell wall-associated NlpC family hydrolase [Chitinophaga terrae (ex Kim and Jung 2007)]